MPIRHRLALLLLGLAACGPAAFAQQAGKPALPRLINSDFAQPLAEGWAQALDTMGGSTVSASVDSGLLVAQQQCGRTAVEQEIDFPTRPLALKATLRFHAETNKDGYYAYGSMLLSYLDKTGKVLGQTRVVRLAGEYPWKNSGRLHLIPVAADDAWADYRISFGNEVQSYLKDVDPSAVKRVRITFESFGSGAQSC